MANVDWITAGLRGYFPNANIHVTSKSVGITVVANGKKQWYGKSIEMPSEEGRQTFLDDTVKWFQNRFGVK